MFLRIMGQGLAYGLGTWAYRLVYTPCCVKSRGIIATILELLRYREQYVRWIITDIVSVGMYIAHFDAVYLTKRSIYLIMAVIGLVNWAKLNRTRNTVNE